MAAMKKSQTKISSKLNPKTVDPFAQAKKKSAFASVYSSGGVPCRLVHGSVRHSLNWEQEPEHLNYDPLLVTLAEGLRETVHPYAFVARQGFKELLEAPTAGEKTVPLLTRVVGPLRIALSEKNEDVFDACLDALVLLSSVVGPHLNPHLKTLLQSVSRRSLEKRFKDKVIESLHVIEQNGGREALLAIKARVPHYTSINL